jgi:anti-sigma regulatory factor (Ser/Thr protein kinase)
MPVVRRRFPARASSLSEIRAFVQSRTAEATFAPHAADDLTLAVDEACSNSVRHSNSSSIEVVWRRLPDGAEIEVRDEGTFRPPSARFAGQAPPVGGYGIRIIRSLVDEVEIVPGTPRRPGTRVRLVMRTRATQVSG